MDLFAEATDPLFSRWLFARMPQATMHSYVARSLYGDFLEEQVREALSRHRGIRHYRDRVADLAPGPGGFRLELESGAVLPARAVVLAIGNLRPDPLDAEAGLSGVIDDPWNIPGLAEAGTVLIAGTGLTALDVAVDLAERSPYARFILAARHPFFPPEDSIEEVRQGFERLIGLGPSALWHAALADLRQRGRPLETVDGIRPHVEEIWQAWSWRHRATFMRHGARHWLHHRHRTPPQTAARIGRLAAEGRLSLKEGRVQEIRGAAGRLKARVGTETVEADRIVNATGPSLRLDRSPLLRRAASAGMISPCPLGLGIAVEGNGVALGPAGGPVPGLYVLGALTRGAFFEVIAVPHIRRKAARIAEELAGLPGDASGSLR
jgi:uncharacterized NAD(P)/FAD-binding protein YdhS